jgi:hypothetical protein
MTAPAPEVASPIYILMKPADGEARFVDIRPSVQEVERLLGGCQGPDQESPAPFLHFDYFDDRGRPFHAVLTSEGAVALQPREETPDRHRMWDRVEQALRNMDQYLQAHPDARASFGESFETFRSALSRHRVDPGYPVDPMPNVYGPYGLCCRFFRFCCLCWPPDGNDAYRPTAEA